MTAEQLSAIAGVLLSLAFAYVPKVKEWYTARQPTEQAGIMAALLVVVAVGAFSLSCAQFVSLNLTCDKSGVSGLVAVLFNALVANQSAYVLLVRPVKKAQDVYQQQAVVSQ